MDHASTQRFTAMGEDNKPQAIKATDEWLSALKELPYKSCKFIYLSIIMIIYYIEKNGKTLYLLKQSSKVISAKKIEKGSSSPRHH